MKGGNPMGVAKVLPKGQITVPKAVRDRLGIEAGDELLLEAVSDREARIIVLPRPTSLRELRGLVRPRRPLDDQAVERAIEEGRRGLAESWKASRRAASTGPAPKGPMAKGAVSRGPVSTVRPFVRKGRVPSVLRARRETAAAGDPAR